MTKTKILFFGIKSNLENKYAINQDILLNIIKNNNQYYNNFLTDFFNISF